LEVSKTIVLLRSLNEIEFKQFGRFIKSDSSQTHLYLLYKYLAKYYPKLEHKNFNRTNCTLFVFSELKQQVETLNKQEAEKLLRQKLKNPLHYLSVALENFFINLELKEESFEKNMLLLKSLRRRKLDDECISIIDKELQKQSKSKIKRRGQPLEQFQYLHFKRNLTNKLNGKTVGIEPLLGNLDQYYFHTKLLYNCEIVTHNKISGKENENLLIPEISQIIEKRKIENTSPSVLLNVYLSDLLRANGKIEYDFVKAFYFKNFESFCNEDKTNAVLYLINYCNQALRSKQSAKLAEMFSLYDFASSKNLLIEDNTIESSNFKNIVTISTALNKHEWAFDFINKNRKYLKTNDADNVIKLSLARVYQSKGEDGRVIKLIQNIVFQDVFDNIVVRTMMVKSYFSLKEWHTLDFYFESFQKFVKRNKTISVDMKLALSNMISVSRKLVKANTTDSYSKKNLEELIQNTKPLFMSSWLHSKINQLKI